MRPLILLLLSVRCALGQEVHEYIDLQLHPCIHIPYRIYGEGLQFFDENSPPKLSWRHQFKNVNYANYLRRNKGARILVVGALTKENVPSAKRARKVIQEQIDYVNRFVAENADDFALGRSPQEVRDLVHGTDKTVIIHSIEGGKRLIGSKADAESWAAQGVAFITLIHLVDSELGGAAIRPGLATHLINFRGLWRRQSKRGLTERGKQAIRWLAEAGIMTDLTHMSDQSRADALALMEADGLAPLVTHDLFKPLHNSPRGITEEDMLRIYRQGGLMSLPISGITCQPHRPRADYRAQLDTMPHYCDGSIDSYKLTYLSLKSFLERNLPMEGAEELAIGFQSDFNGGLNHHRPRYGKEGCWPAQPGGEYEPIELHGLAHPGLLESHWRLLEKEGVDLLPVQRSAEKFLQMWQRYLDRREDSAARGME